MGGRVGGRMGAQVGAAQSVRLPLSLPSGTGIGGCSWAVGQANVLAGERIIGQLLRCRSTSCRE